MSRRAGKAAEVVKQVKLRFHCVDRDDESTVKETVATLATGFRCEQAGVAGSAVQGVFGVKRCMVAAQRVT